MDVHVDVLERHVEEQGRDRVPVAGDEVAIGAAQRSDEKTVLHWAGVHEEILLVRDAAVERREADHTGEAHAIALAVDTDAVTVQLVSKQFGDTCGSFAGPQSEDSAPVMVEGEPNVAARHRQPPHRVATGRVLGARAAQKLPPSRHLVEQPLDLDSGTRRKRRWSLADRGTMIDFDSP